MATQVVVPAIGESITSVVLLSWEKQVGDAVHLGDVLGELETDKSAVPLECPANGEVLAILVEEGVTVEIGTPLVVIGKPGESWTIEQSAGPSLDAADGARTATSDPSISAMPTVAARETGTRPADGALVKAAPSARRLAQELGVDVGAVASSIGGKRVTEAHVRAFASPEAEGAPGRSIELSRIRRVVAERMTTSAQTIPQFSVSIQIDATGLEAARDATLGEGGKTSLTAYLVWAASNALIEHPMVNARYQDGNTVYAFGECNIAVAVDTSDGLVAPVLHNTAEQSPAELSERLGNLVERARSGDLSPDDQADATFTISNLGPAGAVRFTPMVVPGQGAILGIGAVRKVPVASSDGGTLWSSAFEATLAADHRVTDGAEATRFLAAFRNAIEALQ